MWYTSDRNKKQWLINFKNQETKENDSTKYAKKNKREKHHIQWKKARAKFMKLAKK